MLQCGLAVSFFLILTLPLENPLTDWDGLVKSPWGGHTSTWLSGTEVKMVYLHRESLPWQVGIWAHREMGLDGKSGGEGEGWGHTDDNGERDQTNDYVGTNGNWTSLSGEEVTVVERGSNWVRMGSIYQNSWLLSPTQLQKNRETHRQIINACQLLTQMAWA